MRMCSTQVMNTVPISHSPTASRPLVACLYKLVNYSFVLEELRKYIYMIASNCEGGTRKRSIVVRVIRVIFAG